MEPLSGVAGAGLANVLVEMDQPLPMQLLSFTLSTFNDQESRLARGEEVQC
jgi:hypothetical protein